MSMHFLPTENMVRPVKILCIFPALLLLTFIVMSTLLQIPRVQHWLAWWRHSSLLPESASPFLGREREQSELTEWLDLQSDEVRVINIVGPTGIGKSALAIQLGHQLIDRGATVSYVDTSLIGLEGITGEILRGTSSTSMSGNSTWQLLEWLRREMKYPLVIELDNCDGLLATERTTLFHFLDVLFTSAATTVKVIITSRNIVKPAYRLEKFMEYQIGEIYPDASCQLLSAVSKREMNEGMCTPITELTGNIPLSLMLIGSILESTPVDEITKIVSLFEKETKLLRNPLPEKQLNASVMISLKSLKKRLINLGKYLSLFPTSFTLMDACSVLHSLIDDDCAWIDILHQRNLLLVSETNHYHFRDIVKEQLVRIRGSSKVNVEEFWKQYVIYFTMLLHKRSLEFHKRPNYALELENEEMRQFLRKAIEYCKEIPTQCVQLLHTLKVTIDTQYISSLYADKDLTNLLQDIFTMMEHVLRDSSVSGADTVNIYISLTLSIMKHQSLNLEPVFEQARHWVDEHSDGCANATLVEQFYLKLSTHYSRVGRTEDEIYCHLKVLKQSNMLIDCDPSVCCYSEISDAYYTLGRYDLSGYFQRLHIQHSNLSSFGLAKALLRLHSCQTGNLSEARSTVSKLTELSTIFMDAETMVVRNNLELYCNVSIIFRQHDWAEEAWRVEQRIIAAVRKGNYTEAECRNTRLTLYSLIDSLVAAKEYGTVPEVVKCVLDTYKDENYNSTEVAALQLVLGKAQLYNRRRRASIDSLKEVIYWYYKDPTLFHCARDACNAMLIQTHIEFACFYIAFEETWLMVQAIWNFVISDTFDPEQFSISHIYDFPTIGLVADNISNVPVAPYYLVFFVKWCLANVQYLFSCRFIIVVVNWVFIVCKFAYIVSSPFFSFFLLYGMINYIKRLYRILWIPVWSDEYL